MKDSCPSVNLIRRYVNADLPPVKTAAVERHLARCAACSARRDRYRLFNQMLARCFTRGREIPEALPADLLPPTVPRPTTRQLADWLAGQTAQATDGCEVETDGICRHGYPSWLVHLKFI